MRRSASLKRDGISRPDSIVPTNGRAVGDVTFSFPLSRSCLADWHITLVTARTISTARPLSGMTWRSTSSAMTAASKKNCRMGGSSRRSRPPVGSSLKLGEGMHGDDPADWRGPKKTIGGDNMRRRTFEELWRELHETGSISFVNQAYSGTVSGWAGVEYRNGRYYHNTDWNVIEISRNEAERILSAVADDPATVF